MTGAEAPFVAGELVGLRTWPLVGGHRLRAAGWDELWPDRGRALEATCKLGADHAAPAPGCSCGIYAWHPRPSSAEELFAACSRGGAVAAGLVEVWGDIEVHRTGFRAQYARPAAFVIERRRAGRAYARRIRRLAARHGAEVIVVDSAADLYRHCVTRGLGLRESAVEELLAPRREAARRRRRASLRLRRAAAALVAPALAVALWRMHL